MKQCTQLTAKDEFYFKPGTKYGRKLKVAKGATFWVCSSETSQKDTGLIHIARVTQPMHYDYGFTPDQIETLFERVS